MIEEKHSIVFKFLMPASVMPIAMLREWVCIVNCQKNYICIYLSLLYFVCVCIVRCKSVAATVGFSPIQEHWSSISLLSAFLHILFLCIFFSMFIFIVLCSDSAVCLPALQTWCTRSSVAYLSSRPVVVYCLKVLSTRL